MAEYVVTTHKREPMQPDEGAEEPVQLEFDFPDPMDAFVDAMEEGLRKGGMPAWLARAAVGRAEPESYDVSWYPRLKADVFYREDLGVPFHPSKESTMSEPLRLPHCDARILHAPGECQYCDDSGLQPIREAWNIAFTDQEPKEGQYPCPANVARSDESLASWGGNQRRSELKHAIKTVTEERDG